MKTESMYWLNWLHLYKIQIIHLAHGEFQFTWITHPKYVPCRKCTKYHMYDTISKDSKVNVFLTLYYTCIRKMWKHLKHDAWCIMNKKCLQHKKINNSKMKQMFLIYFCKQKEPFHNTNNRYLGFEYILSNIPNSCFAFTWCSTKWYSSSKKIQYFRWILE